MLAIDEAQVPDLLVRAQVDAWAVEWVFRTAPAISCLSFSRALPDERVGLWRAELEWMRGDGSFAQLQREWLGH
ncbi:MAG: hypothetical protein ACRCTL_08295 [Pseudomonas sp.]